jgi:hypothetical protein
MSPQVPSRTKGRPIRNKHVPFKVSAEEKMLLSRLAEKSQMNVSEYCRAKVFGPPLILRR